MKVALPKENKDKSSYKLCIGLTPERAIDHESDEEPIGFTCSHTPGVDGAATYKLKVYPFKDGYSCEQYLRTIKSLNDIIKGQGLTTNAQKVLIVNQLFEGSTWVAFDNEMPNDPTHPITNPMYTRGLAAMAKVVFPANAARNQKKAMKKIRKPIDMKFRDFANRMKQLNDYLPYFPPLHNGHAPRSMGDDEFHDVLHDALPKGNYQEVMQRFDYDPTVVTLPDFIEWVTRRCEPWDEKKGANPSSNNGNPSGQKSSKKRQQPADSKQTSNKRGKFCLLHGHCGHTTDQCKVMKARAEEMQKNNPKREKFPYKSKKDFKTGNDQHAMEMTKEALESFLVSEAYNTHLTQQVGGICNKLFKGFKRSLEDSGFDGHAMEAHDDENDAYEALLKLNKADDNKPFDESD